MQYSLLILATLIISSCTYNTGISDPEPVMIDSGSSTIQQHYPYTIGTVDTAFKLI